MAAVGGLQSRHRFFAVAAVLVLAVAAIYGQTSGHAFIAYDDDSYIYKAPQVTRGLTLPGLRWAFGYHMGNWHPLTWLSHMLDVQLFGLWAGGHHLVSAGLHAANAVLLAAVLTAATGAFWRSAVVAALFAVHPLRVESVAWAAERKDVLSALLGLLALGAYLRYARRPGIGRYLVVLGLFALGLAAKPMLVTLPVVLLLLDWWPLGRLRSSEAPHAETSGASVLRPRLHPLVEKIPLLALSVAASIITVQAQSSGIVPIVAPDLSTRVANAAISYVRYLGSFVWPNQLAFLYPYPGTGVPMTAASVAAAALVLTTVAALSGGRRRPFLPVGWFWYLGSLVPVIGLVQAGGQARADRYTYLATTGIAIAVVWLAAEHWPRRPGARRALASLSALGLITLGMAADAYTSRWRDSLTLFDYTLRSTQENYLVQNNLGTVLMEAGRYDDAIAVLQETTRTKPTHCNAHYNLGTALLRRDRDAEAVEALYRSLRCYEREGRREPYVADAHYNIGVALVRLVRYPEAERHLQAALRIIPDYPEARAALDDVLWHQGKKVRGGRVNEPR